MKLLDCYQQAVYDLLFKARTTQREAIEKAGTVSAKDGLAESYGAMDYQTINGRYVFKEDHTAIASPEYLVISAAQVQDGSYKVVWPDNFAYAEAVPQK